MSQKSLHQTRAAVPHCMRSIANTLSTAKAFEQGAKAAAMGLAMDVNNHAEDSPEWKAWNQGWRKGAK
jgi:membrane protease subunit (stomatin/prohibitin family)